MKTKSEITEKTLGPNERVKNGKIITRRANGTVKVTTINDLPSRTQKQFKDKVNINSIMAKYRKTGLIEHVRKTPGKYMDLTKLPDYQTALQTVIHAQNTFETIPANIRKRFNNDPAELISFLGDSKNMEEAIKLGLVVKKPEPGIPEPTPPEPK